MSEIASGMEVVVTGASSTERGTKGVVESIGPGWAVKKAVVVAPGWRERKFTVPVSDLSPA